MTRESELFALARGAFEATLPTEDETRTVARRLELRLRERTRRRRFAPLLSVAFALAGALAYAAEAARVFDAAPQRAPRAPVEASGPLATRGIAPTLPASAASALTPATTATTTVTTTPARSRAAPSAATAAPGRTTRPARQPASWAGVARSLARGDQTAARLELERLSARGNPRDRANAAVELARLAAHRGECARARKHLENARTLLQSSPSLTRAADAVQRCESRAAPAGPPVMD